MTATTEQDSAVAAAIAGLLGGQVQDPFPLYDQLREAGDGVHWAAALNGWLVTRYDDVRTVAQDHGTFSSDIFFSSPPGLHDPDVDVHRRFVDINSRELMFADPPRHTRLRSIFRSAFTPAAVDRWRPLVESVTDQVLGRFRPGQEVELMSQVAADVPVAVIAAMLGVPAEQRDKFREWSFAFASTFDPMVAGERRDECIRTSMQMLDYLAEVLADRRAHPQDDLTSLLAAARSDDGTPLADADLLAQLALLLVAGNETTTNLIGNGISLLLAHPAARGELARDRSLLPNAMEEMLRIDPPLHLTARKTTAPVVLGNQEIPADALVITLMGAANRDPRAYASPEAFDIHRQDNRHLSFFHGIHFCVGSPLARMEGEVMFDRFLTRFPDFADASTPAVRRTSNVISRGWATRPVRL